MTLDEMRLMVKQMSGDENGLLFSDPIILSYLNICQKQIAARTECLADQTTITSLDSTGGALLPVNFYKPIHVSWAGTQLYEVSPDLIRTEGIAQETSTQAPQGYCIFPYFQTSATVRNARMEFWPPATGSQTGLSIVVNYLAYPDDLVNGTDVSGLPEIMHDMLVLMALKKCKLQEDDYQAAREIQTEVDRQFADAIFTTHGSYMSFAQIRDPNEISRNFYDW